MFRTNLGFSELNENIRHRFVVSGKNVVWKNGRLIEENLKENSISFWIQKDDRYSELVAEEEIPRRSQLRRQTIKQFFLENLTNG